MKCIHCHKRQAQLGKLCVLCYVTLFVWWVACEIRAGIDKW
jgi:hypothetical protein